MKKGYLTIYLSLSLSLLTGFILLLTGLAVKNAGRVRLECAADTAMNSVLGEFHTELLERYGLLYVDASYRGGIPSISRLEDRLQYYMEENTSRVLNREHGPWGSLYINSVSVVDFETAAAGNGASMRNQAVCYGEDAGLSCEEADALDHAEEAAELDSQDMMEQWNNLMEQIAEMELPKILNEEGIWEEVPLANPADWVYGLAGSDILYLAQADLSAIGMISVSLEEALSHRQAVNRQTSGRSFREDDALFFSYLFQKMGSLDKPVEGGVLVCQLEYLAKGQSTDLENVRAVAEQLFRWRFADNGMLAMADGGLCMQAEAAAKELLAVQLKEEFLEPVTKSILYACAFLETVSDLRTLYRGGRVPLRKGAHHMSVDNVLGGGLYCADHGFGYTYRQYLACMLALMEAEQLNLRAMDVMEMDIRFLSGNPAFSMDWCIERFEAVLSASNHARDEYSVNRKYGYF